MISDVTVSRAISQRFFEKFQSALELDTAIVGAGPAGLVAGRYLAQAGKRVALFESKLSTGGGIWGGGMLFNEIVVQHDALSILDDFGIRYREFEDGCYTADAVHTAAALAYGATAHGLTVFNACCVEDVVFSSGRVSGVVVLWSPVTAAGLHVDPLSVSARTVLDATGHDCDITRVTVRKMGVQLNTETGDIMGEKCMWAESGEKTVVEKTGQIFPGLYVAGMAAAAVHGGYRMGPVFGGMLLSGRKAAEQIIADLDRTS
ncbi:sulfide-dependent adenosine diphosphate thiazole synthase [bacterium]|nr:sulfide-dependent adenosine diphosphate thiazole synthase [bacterium]